MNGHPNMQNFSKQVPLKETNNELIKLLKDANLSTWLSDTHRVLHWPLTVLSVFGLLILGSFIEITSRDSIEFLDNRFGKTLLFILPFVMALLTDWATGLLAVTIVMILYARLEIQDSKEGFSDSEKTSPPKKWFSEKILGDTPQVISGGQLYSSNSNNSEPISNASKSIKSLNTINPISLITPINTINPQVFNSSSSLK
jgi:hypothetical protein